MSETSLASPQKKLVLVDAYSLLFRAFFGGRPLSTRDNRPTGALFGFANMLFSLLHQEKPDAIIVCWDAPGPTLREQEFAAYKAHRPEVDPQLRAQFSMARALVAAFGIASAEAPGYEADDLIGTFSGMGVRQGYHVLIFTGDSDQLQLVGDGITVQMTQRGVSEVKSYDANAVRERYGVGPEGIADWKALVGDTSDNIPGVPGIGEKTATTLLQQWHSLENLLEHVAEVTPPRAQQTLEANIEQARFSKRLATIHRDVPVELDIHPYAPTEEDYQTLRALFLDLEFKSLLARIPRLAGSTATPLTRRELGAPDEAFAARLVRIENAEQFAAALAEARQSGSAAIAMEADNALAMRAEWRGIAFAPSAEVGYYVPLRLHPRQPSVGLGNLFAEAEAEEEGYRAVPEDLRPLLESPDIAKSAHNAKFAEILMECAGLHPAPFIFDTQVAAYLLDSGRASYPLMDLAEVYLNVRLEADDAYAPGETLAREAALIHALVPALRSQLESIGVREVMDKIEMPLIPVLAAIEQAGIGVDTAYLNTLSARMAAEIDALAREIYTLAGEEFNIGSPKQLQTILFEKMQLPHGKKTKTGYSTGADILEQLAPEQAIAKKIIDYREVAKLKATYADALVKLLHPKTGRVHTSLNQTVASTGRLSSSDPNLQNIPVRSEIGREIRRAFIAPKGRVLLSCDYSQIELRILAHIAQDPALVQAFQADEDIHAATASRVFDVPLSEVTPDQRRQAKTINFAVIYGQSGYALGVTLGVETSTANEWIKEYFERLPGVKRYVEETTARAHQQKYVATLMGRRRYLPELDSGNHSLRQFAERAAVNMPIQGTAADIMKLAMIDVYGYLQKEKVAGCLLLLQVHDELLFEIEEALIPSLLPQIRKTMEEAFPMDVRLKVDAKAGPNWADMRSV